MVPRFIRVADVKSKNFLAFCVCVCVLCQGEGRSGDQSFRREIRWNSSETRAFSCSLTVRSHHGLCRRPLLESSVEVRKVTMPLAIPFLLQAPGAMRM